MFCQAQPSPRWLAKSYFQSIQPPTPQKLQNHHNIACLTNLLAWESLLISSAKPKLAGLVLFSINQFISINQLIACATNLQIWESRFPSSAMTQLASLVIFSGNPAYILILHKDVIYFNIHLNFKSKTDGENISKYCSSKYAVIWSHKFILSQLKQCFQSKLHLSMQCSDNLND